MVKITPLCRERLYILERGLRHCLSSDVGNAKAWLWGKRDFQSPRFFLCLVSKSYEKFTLSMRGGWTRNKTSIKMRKVGLLFCALLCTTVLMAQQQLAMLHRNDSLINVYYGSDAFVDAYRAARTGDVITLSDGAFNSCEVKNKGLTIRGNGAAPDTARGTLGTQFVGDFLLAFDIRSTDTTFYINIEGVYFPQLSTYDYLDSCDLTLELTRCMVNNFYKTTQVRATAINCIIRSSTGTYSTSSVETTDLVYPSTFINCVLYMSNNIYSMPAYSTCTNCIIYGADRTVGNSTPSNNYYTNCIVINRSNSSDTILNRNCRNSILCGFSSCANSHSYDNVSMNVRDVFENWDGETLLFQDDVYHLKANVASSVLGLDGTQVGIYGGLLPFSATPIYNNFIKKCNVAYQTTADGKLSVEIEVATK